MCNSLRGIAIIAFVFALVGCHGGGLTVGGSFFPVEKDYQIVGSNFDESYRMAYRAIEECNLEIYKADEKGGKIYARANKSQNTVGSDYRDVSKNVSEFRFSLQRMKSGDLFFNIISNDQEYIDEFVRKYSNHIKFSDKVGKEKAEDKKNDSEVLTVKEALSRDSVPGAEETKSSIPYLQTVTTESKPILSEVRNEPQGLSDDRAKYNFSRQEIARIQTFLIKLGYDPGSIDGEMTRKTMDAIGKFKAENGFIMDLFQQ